MEGTIAEVRIFAGNFAPRNWAFCEGQLLAINSNQALFSIIGTIYGGDGRTTFALPDLRGRTAIGPGHGPGLSSYREGQKGGVEHVTLNITQIPSHNHLASGTVKPLAKNGQPDESNPGGQFPSSLTNSTEGYAEAANRVMGQSDVTVTVLNNGGSQSHENRQPWLSIYYIICLQGVFPSRS